MSRPHLSQKSTIRDHRAQASSMNAAALSEALSEYLAPWEKVRRIAVVDELPTTATGKPDPLAAAEIVTASER